MFSTSINSNQEVYCHWEQYYEDDSQLINRMETMAVGRRPNSSAARPHCVDCFNAMVLIGARKVAKSGKRA